MEPEGSIPNSQELSSCPYPEPDQSSPHHPIPPLQDPSWYYPPTYVLVFLVAYVSLASPPTTFLFSPFVLHAPPISSSSPNFPNYTYLAKSTNHEALHYTVISILLSPHLFSVQISSSDACFHTPPVYVPSLMSETKFHTHTEPQVKLQYCILYFYLWFCMGVKLGLFFDSKREDRRFWTEWLLTKAHTQ
jgi:hypothetical protein